MEPESGSTPSVPSFYEAPADGDALQPSGVGQPVKPPPFVESQISSTPTFTGSIGSGAAGSGSSTHIDPEKFGGEFDNDFNEPPLLEELGINIDHILLRMQGVALFKKVDEEILRDADLSGPLAIVLALGMCLLLSGKFAFGCVYGMGATGCGGVFLIINLMSRRDGIDLYRTMSILGYGLLPIVVLAFLGIIVNLTSRLGGLLSAMCICWSTATTSRFFATAISMQQQRWLLAYPVGLVYTCFTLITVF